MKWVTRQHIRVNRTATAWFIRRFVDPTAEFFFVPDAEVAEVQDTRGATGFDASGARYPHKDAKGRCSFEALVFEHRPDDAALRELAWIVHCADYADEVHRVPEAAGLRTISQGFPLITHDHDIVDRACFLYDALYAVLLKRGTRAVEAAPPAPRPASVPAPPPPRRPAPPPARGAAKRSDRDAPPGAPARRRK
jgi:hypothetical protein